MKIDIRRNFLALAIHEQFTRLIIDEYMKPLAQTVDISRLSPEKTGKVHDFKSARNMNDECIIS